MKGLELRLLSFYIVPSYVVLGLCGSQMTMKRSIYHVLSAIRPEFLRSHLESDFKLLHYNLRENFKRFMVHAIKLSEAFQLVYNGAPFRPKENRKGKRGAGRSEMSDDEKLEKRKAKSSSRSEIRTSPVCLDGLHKVKGYSHYLRDCTTCPEDEKKFLLKHLVGKRAATGPAKTTGKQQRNFGAEQAKYNIKPGDRVAGRINAVSVGNSSSFKVLFMDGSRIHFAMCRADDGAHE